MIKRLFFLLFIVLFIQTAYSDEGMWILPLVKDINMNRMKELGWKLSADEIYSVNHSSIKDAVPMFGHMCSSEMISADGLLLTNHHCGYDYIQSHSTVEHDYLQDGFWAMSRSEELPNPGLTATFLVRMDDVTMRFDSVLSDTMSEHSRKAAIDELSQRLISEATDSTHYIAEVHNFFKGNVFYLMIFEEFLDVRLVGAPPESVGKFGGDMDNWMWPRHTGDFSFFRVYTAPDGKPAAYSEKNIPYKPKHFFPISLKGIKASDFAMVVGYPGKTDRYCTSYEIREMQEVINPNRIKLRGLRQEVMERRMKDNDTIRIKYSAKYSTSSNYWKYSIGQNDCFRKFKTLEYAQAREEAFRKWVNSDSARIRKYGDCLSLIEQSFTERRQLKNAQQYIYETVYNSIDMIGLANEMFSLYAELSNPPDERFALKEQMDQFRSYMNTHFRDYDMQTDKEIALAELRALILDVEAEYLPYVVLKGLKKYKSFTDYLNYVYSHTIFVSAEKLEKFLQRPNLKKLQKDPGFEMAYHISYKYDKIRERLAKSAKKYDRGMRLYMQGLREMEAGKPHYPDANFTLRLTFGSVGGFSPKDAVEYDFFTTHRGITEKADPSNPDFNVPSKLLNLCDQKDFGVYAKNNELPVCFITNNDITGGNSGSPVLNGKGELIGIAFDGNWEGLNSDIKYEEPYQKCIAVDIRYALFILDKYAGAGYLLNEMKLIR